MRTEVAQSRSPVCHWRERHVLYGMVEVLIMNSRMNSDQEPSCRRWAEVRDTESSDGGTRE